MEVLEKNMPLISVIVPIYNVEPFLRRCIDSIINQTYRNLEILLVNDGSPDGCGNICDKYAKNDKRIIVMHKVNEGVYSARNKGLDMCTGDYIVFVDSDDYLALGCIETLVRLCLENNAEISIIDYLYVNETENDEIKIPVKEKIYHFSAKEAIEHSLYQKLYSCSLWGKIYRSDILLDIRFPTEAYTQDLAVSHIIFSNASKVIFFSSIGYYYRKRSTSIMNRPFDHSHLVGLSLALEIEDYCEKKYPELLKAAKCRTFNTAIHPLLKMSKNTAMYYKYYDFIIEEIRRTRLSVIFNKKSRLREKAAAILSFMGLSVLKMAWNSPLAIKQRTN